MAISLETPAETSFKRATNGRSFFMPQTVIDTAHALPVIKSESAAALEELQADPNHRNDHSRILGQSCFAGSGLSYQDAKRYADIELLYEASNRFPDAKSSLIKPGLELAEQITKEANRTRVVAFSLDNLFFWVEDGSLCSENPGAAGTITHFRQWPDRYGEDGSRNADGEDCAGLIRAVHLSGQLIARKTIVFDNSTENSLFSGIS